MSDNDINDLLKAFDNPNHCYPQDLVDAIRLLVKERDEARRMACGKDETIGGAMIEADLLGWDCFKDKKND